MHAHRKETGNASESPRYVINVPVWRYIRACDFVFLSLCCRKLISWVCQAAMKALQATGSCYHSQVRRADKPTMTAEPGMCVCVRPLCARRTAYACVFPRPEDRNLSMAAEIVSIPEIPPDSKQQDRRHMREREGEKEREREAFCQSYPFCIEHRCNISQDKGSSVLRNILLNRHGIWRP